nr:probable galacturonosyltransferase-like 7 [Tanacetum cinerariifolium]
MFQIIHVMITLFRSAEAIRSGQLLGNSGSSSGSPPSFRASPSFRNAPECSINHTSKTPIDVCDTSLIHVAITLDFEYLRGSVAAVHSVLQHSACPETVFFHFLVCDTSLEILVKETFPKLSDRKPCYFNTGVMVIDLEKWRQFGYTKRIERWMEIQKTPIDHAWNQHGLGGDNVKGSCRDLHPGPVSLLHWSGSGKPWLRLDSKQPCPLDSLWAPYDLYGQSS